jgi:hypothetical protein
MDYLTMQRWSPYAVGIGIGILGSLVFLLSDRYIGCSAAFSRTAGMIEKLFRRKKVEESPYYQKLPPVIEWEGLMVFGIIIGALVSAVISGDFKLMWVPAKWSATFGTSSVLRVCVAVGGGIFMGFGARWANGCTSGHGISGTLQLAVSSWIAAVCFFIGGIATAMLIFNCLGA